MKGDKYFEYLKELKELEGDDFFYAFSNFFDLLLAENKVKTEVLKKKAGVEYEKDSHLGEQANHVLASVLEEIGEELKREGLTIKKMDFDALWPHNGLSLREECDLDYPDVKAKYLTIAETLEKYYSDKRLTKFAWIIRKDKSKKYRFDSSKFNDEYPDYENFNSYIHSFENQSVPWWAYSYLIYLISLVKEVYETASINGSDEFKLIILACLQCLIFYFAPPASAKETQPPLKNLGIPTLFALSEHPLAVFYEGKNKTAQTDWVRLKKGITQPYAVLKLAAERYDKSLRKTDRLKNCEIRLSFPEIEEYLKKVNQPLRWQDLTAKEERKLNTLRRNIFNLVGFTDEELAVDKTTTIPHLIFKLSA